MKEAEPHHAANTKAAIRPIEQELLFLTEVKRGLEGGHIRERQIKKLLRHSRFGYSKAESTELAGELIEALDPKRHISLQEFIGKGLNRLDPLVRYALLLREDMTEKVKSAILTTFPASETMEKASRFLSRSYGTGPVAEIISQFNSLSEGRAGTDFGHYALVFSRQAAEKLEKALRVESDPKGDYHKLAAALPRLKLNPYNRVDGSPSKGTLREGNRELKIEYNGKVENLYYAGANGTNIRATYIIVPDAGKGAGHVQIRVIDFFTAHQGMH